MKKTLKIIAIALCLVLVLCPLSPAASASSPVDSLKVTVSTDKGNYGLFEKAVVTVTVENIGNEAVTDVSAGVSGGDYLPVRGSKTCCSTPVLLPGDVCSVSFIAVLSPDTEGLNFFKSLLLKIRGIFVKTDELPLTGISNEYTVRDEVKTVHADTEAGISAYAVCGDNTLNAADTEKSQELLALYNSAVIKTNKTTDVSGESRISLRDIRAEDSLAKIYDIFFPYLEQTVANNVFEVNKIPGKGLLQTDDIENILYSENGGNITLLIRVKEQTDGFDSDPENSGPVSRAVETLGSLDGIIEEMGAEIISGKETVTINYSDAYIACVIDENSIITGGKWFYTADLSIDDLKLLMFNNEISFSDFGIVYDFIVEV